MTAAQIPNPRDFFAKTSCTKCGDVIDADEHRLVLMAVEMNPEQYEPDYVPAGPGHSETWAFCDVCLAEMKTLDVPNIWHLARREFADASAGPRSEDASTRWTSLPGIAEKLARNSDDEESSAQDIEDTILTSNEKPTRPEPPSQDDLRLRMERFLGSPESRKMTADIRKVAELWCHGAKQREISEELGIDQATVSRRLGEAKQLVGAHARHGA